MSKPKEKDKKSYSKLVNPFHQIVVREKKLLARRKEEFKQGEANSNQEVRHSRDQEFLHRGLTYLGIILGLCGLLEFLSFL